MLPHPVTVTPRIIAFLVVDSYWPSFATATVRGSTPRWWLEVADGAQIQYTYNKSVLSWVLGTLGERYLAVIQHRLLEIPPVFPIGTFFET